MSGSRAVKEADTDEMRRYVHEATSGAQQVFGIVTGLSCVGSLILLIIVLPYFGGQAVFKILALLAAAGPGLIPIALAHDW